MTLSGVTQARGHGLGRLIEKLLFYARYTVQDAQPL